MEQRKKKTEIPVGLLLWKDQYPLMDLEKLINMLVQSEKLLAQLPQEKAAVARLLETLLTAAHYRWLLNNNQKSESCLNKVIVLSKTNSLSSMQAWVLNTKGIDLYERSGAHKANTLFKQALDHDPNNRTVMINISITAHRIGKRKDGIISGKQAIKRDPNNPNLWNVLGFLYLSMEKMEAAIVSIKRVQLIAPGDLHTYYSLAVCYYKNDQMDECIKEISELGRISSDQDVIQSACISIMTNKANDAYIQLKQVFENGRIAKHQILRDPNLQILLKPYKNMIFN